MKPIFLKIGIAIIFIAGLLYGCSRDRELAELSWTFDVETPNKDIDIGLEVGQEVDLTYIVKKNYETGANISYEIVTTTTNFSVINDQNENIQLNKEYSIDKDTLRLKYRGLDRGEQEFKILFKNTKGHQIEKKIRFNFDGFGFSITPLSKEKTVGSVLNLKYLFKDLENRKSEEFIVKVIEDEAGGTFINDDGSFLAKKGDSFILKYSEQAQILKYVTRNVTKEGKDFDTIVLEIMPKNGNQSQRERVAVKQKFLLKDYDVTIEFPDKEVIIPNREYAFTINVKEKIEEDGFIYGTTIATNILPALKGNIFFIHNNKIYQEMNDIPLVKGANRIAFVSKLKLNTKFDLQFTITVDNTFKKITKTVDVKKFWFYPKIDFDVYNQYFTCCTSDFPCFWGDNAGGSKFLINMKGSLTFDDISNYSIEIESSGANFRLRESKDFQNFVPNVFYAILNVNCIRDNKGKNLEGQYTIKIHHIKYGNIINATQYFSLNEGKLSNETLQPNDNQQSIYMDF